MESIPAFSAVFDDQSGSMWLQIQFYTMESEPKLGLFGMKVESLAQESYKIWILSSFTYFSEFKSYLTLKLTLKLHVCQIKLSYLNELCQVSIHSSVTSLSKSFFLNNYKHNTDGSTAVKPLEVHVCI